MQVPHRIAAQDESAAKGDDGGRGQDAGRQTQQSEYAKDDTGGAKESARRVFNKKGFSEATIDEIMAGRRPIAWRLLSATWFI